MSQRLNQYDQPIGHAIPDWHARPQPLRTVLQGRYCRLEPLDAARHAADLYAAYAAASDNSMWTYMVTGPFADADSYRRHAEAAAASNDPLHYAVIDLRSGRASGTLALMRIDAANGVMEVGHVTFSPALQRSPVSTEAQYLLMQYCFAELGYRRYEWKCDSLNQPSRAAAARLGFQYEGTFRQVLVYKGRSRDSAWFSITDQEWPALQAGFAAWLAPDNFAENGVQRQSLAALRQAQAGAAASPATTVSQPVTAITVRALQADDYAAWLTLWRGYQTFYHVSLSDAVVATTWQRLFDPAEPMFVLGAFDAQQKMLGMVHAIYHRSCWTEGDYCYLQDLFTAEDARGCGVGRALIEAVYQRAHEHGASRVYWNTHESNATARSLYDKLADRPGFIQYRKLLA